MLITRSTTIALIVVTLMTRATTTGAAGQLAACPQTPNCVSSQATDTQHAIAPFTYTDSPHAAWQRLKTAVRSQARMTIREASEDYLRAEARSRVFGFIDDVEFVLDPDASLIHVRSASRSGYSDFGVNRRRIERIRRAFDVR